jgi:hypothetical protein
VTICLVLNFPDSRWQNQPPWAGLEFLLCDRPWLLFARKLVEVSFSLYIFGI